MAEEGDDAPKYTLVTSAGETLLSSKGIMCEGTATYAVLVGKDEEFCFQKKHKILNLKKKIKN